MFVDRVDAGRRLAMRLEPLRGEDIVVLGLPRGGVPVAAEVAAALGAPMDVILVRKLGVPWQPELGMGAIGEDGVRVLNDDVVRSAAATTAQIAEVEVEERAELERRSCRFRAVRPRVPLDGRVAVIVDDGIATGSTARAACQVARAHGAARVVLAVPVGPVDLATRLAADADETVVIETPVHYFAVGQAYEDFTQISDDEVVDLLRGASAAATAVDEEVVVDAAGVPLPGHLTSPAGATGVVLFAHGSGSSRHSPRNGFVAGILHAGGVGTLLFDLLTGDEERDRANVFDVTLLGGRLAAATRWLRSHGDVGNLPLGYFGASTGAAAALWASTEPGIAVCAVVSRGGRPDLAGERLAAVTAPTLLVVGGDDRAVLGLNRDAAAHLRCEHRLDVVPGATHLFEEPGTLERAASLARDWFLAHLR